MSIYPLYKFSNKLTDICLNSLNPDDELDLPEISVIQIDRLITIMKECKLISIINASNALKAIRPLIGSAKSSHY